MELVGRDDEQVDVLVDEVIDLSNLLLVIIIGRSKLQGDIVVGIRGREEFLIQLVAPNVLGSLGDGDGIVFLARGRARSEEQEKEAKKAGLFHRGQIEAPPKMAGRGKRAAG